MRKVSSLNPAFARGALRAVSAATLACSLVFFGCTTDWTPGSGRPDRSGPAVGPTMPSSTPGSESNNPVVPMTSAMLLPAGAQHVNVDALATAAADQGFRGRVLGSLDPAAPVASTGVAGLDNPTGQFVNPAVIANPQYTVNSTVNSIGQGSIIGADAATTGGAIVGGATIAPSVGVATGALTNVPMTSTFTGSTTGNASVLPSVAATQAQSPLSVVPNTTATNGVVFATPNTILTPTNAAIRTTVGQFAAGPGVMVTTVPSTTAPGTVTVTNVPNGSLTPTVSSGAMTNPTLAANPPIGTVPVNVVPNRVVSHAAVAPRATSATTAVGRASGPLLIVRGANGGITITNVGTAAAVTTPTTGHPLVIQH